MFRSASAGYRVLVCAPYGSDAQSVSQLLGGQGYSVELCPSLIQTAAAINDDVGVVLVTEEALLEDLTPLSQVLEQQPSWCDVPFVLLAGRRAGRAQTSDAIRRRLPESAINVILLERPMSGESLISAVSSAMRARQKQFEVRDQLVQLTSERARLSTLLDALPVGVAFVNPDGTTSISNPEYRRFVPQGGIPSLKSTPEERWEGYASDGHRLSRDEFVAARALKGETVPGIEFLHHPDDGVSVWTRVSGIPLTENDDTVGAISVIVDIDDQKRGQAAIAAAAQELERQVSERTSELSLALERLKAEAKERERAEEALRQSQKMEAIGQLTGGIAHDFNNMLTGILGAIDLLRQRIANGRFEGLDRYMDAASTSAQRAAGLTARLLAFSRRQSLDSRPTDINALTQSLDDLLKRTMTERVVTRIDLCPDLPLATVDANQLESALLNLAINARDAMPEGGTLTVQTDTVMLDAAYCAAHPGLEMGQYVTVAVSDTGVGMTPDVLDKVFDPFFTTKPIGQGTGLGLSMVYGFAKQSGGQVRIHTAQGEGTSVKIFLPAAEHVDEQEPASPVEIHRGQGETVLLVEDDASVRLLVSDVLTELGYKAMEASEPEAAIALLADGHSFDLMVTDVGLPGMNGRQLAEIARKHLPHLPILFITGYAENAAIRSGFLGTNMQMITKPFQIDALSYKIREMLAQSS